MTSAHDFHLLIFTSEIIWLNIFPEFLNCSHMTSKLNILSNHAVYPQKASAICYMHYLFLHLKN